MAPFRQDKEAGRWASAAGLETLDGKGLHEMRFEMSLFRPEIFSQRKKGKKESESYSDQGGNFAELKLALSAGRTGSLSAFERGPVSCSSARNSTRVATFAPFFALFLFGNFYAYPFGIKFSIEFESEFND